MNKQEALKRIEAQKETIIRLTGWAVYVYIEELIKSLDEPQKVVVPQFVAEYIEFQKKNNFHVYGAMRIIEDHYDKRVPEWFYEGNTEKFCLAWIFGYEAEEEKRYLVKIKAICGNHETLNREKHSKKWLFSDREENTLYKTHHTRKELEEAGFGWVFDCPGIEMEEVE